MKSQVLHTVWCHISCEVAGEFWHWSLSGVKGLTLSLPRSKSPFSQPCVNDTYSWGSEHWWSHVLPTVWLYFLVRLQGTFEIDHSWEWKDESWSNTSNILLQAGSALLPLLATQRWSRDITAVTCNATLPRGKLQGNAARPTSPWQPALRISRPRSRPSHQRVLPLDLRGQCGPGLHSRSRDEGGEYISPRIRTRAWPCAPGRFSVSVRPLALLMSYACPPVCFVQAVEQQIMSFGQTPSQLLTEAHPPRGLNIQVISPSLPSLLQSTSALTRMHSFQKLICTAWTITRRISIAFQWGVTRQGISVHTSHRKVPLFQKTDPMSFFMFEFLYNPHLIF